MWWLNYKFWRHPATDWAIREPTPLFDLLVTLAVFFLSFFLWLKRRHSQRLTHVVGTVCFFVNVDPWLLSLSPVHVLLSLPCKWNGKTAGETRHWHKHKQRLYKKQDPRWCWSKCAHVHPNLSSVRLPLEAHRCRPHMFKPSWSQTFSHVVITNPLWLAQPVSHQIISKDAVKTWWTYSK